MTEPYPEFLFLSFSFFGGRSELPHYSSEATDCIDFFSGPQMTVVAEGYENGMWPSTSSSLYCIVTVNLTINTTVGSEAPEASDCGAVSPCAAQAQAPALPILYTIYSSSALFLDPSPQGSACARK